MTIRNTNERNEQLSKTELPIREYTSPEGVRVEAIQIRPGDLAELRNAAWIDDNLRVLTYPTAPSLGFLGDEPPLAMNGRVLADGNYLVKGPAGDFAIHPAASFEDQFKVVGA